jgi:hypothetical protein
LDEGYTLERIHTSPDVPLIGLLRELLEGAGIACMVKNQHLGGAVGEIPPIECWPELWVMRDEDVAAARRIVDEALDAFQTPDAGPWTCPDCGERIEGSFARCWRCGAACPETAQ